MNLALKKRLVGTAVLLLFAAIVWPILFDFDDSDKTESQDWRQATKAIDKEIEKLKAETSEIKSEILGDTTDQPSAQDSLVEQQQLELAVSQHPDLDLPTTIDDLRSDSSASVDDSAKGDKTLSELDDNKVPVAWVVQVATFKNWDNAKQLHQRLLDDDYRSFLRPAISTMAPPYVLLVGPTFDRGSSEQVAKAIATKYKTGEPLIRRFKSGMR